MKESQKREISYTFSGICLEKSGVFSTPELISFLKSAFRHDDFAKVEHVLRLFKEASIDNRLKELKAKLEKEYGKKCENLEKELEIFRTRCDELEMKVSQLVALECGILAVEGELKKCKRLNSTLEERITQLEEELRVACKREERAREKFAGLEEEIKKKERDLHTTFVQLKVENRDLEMGKRRLENVIEDHRKQCGELKRKILLLEEENLILCSKQDSWEKMKLGPKEYLGEICCEEKVKGESCKLGESWNAMNAGRGSSDSPVSYHMRFKGKMSNSNGKFDASADVVSACHSPARESDLFWVAETTPAMNAPSEYFGTVEVKKIADSPANDEGHMSQVRKRLPFKEEESSEFPARMFHAKSAGDVVIIDSDDDVEVIPTSNSNFGNNSLRETFGNVKGNFSQKTLKRTQSDLKNEGAAEENASRSEENFPLSFTQKRRCVSKVVSSDSDGEDDDHDDKVPISKLIKTQLADAIASNSPVNQSSVSLTKSSGGDTIEECISPSRRHLISLQQCEGRKYRAKKSYLNNSIGNKLPPRADNVGFWKSVTSYQPPQKPVPGNPEGNEVEEAESENEGESLGGFIVQGPDVSESEEPSGDGAESDSSLSQLLRVQKNKSTWEYEADMLSSFKEDPALCLKAVCALYRRQTFDEQSQKGTLYINNRGFSKFDVFKGSMLAEMLTDGDPCGPLKKSAKELENQNPEALKMCSQLAHFYSKQLFDIYQNKEDPYFLPC